MKYTNELAVGVSLVVAVAIFVFGIRYLEDVPLFRGTYELNTAFASVNGLTGGSAVRINGVRVGAVENVRLDQTEGNVAVRFHVNRDVGVPEGSYATIGGIAALASIHMNLHLSPADDEVVPEGGFIPGREEGDMLEMVTEAGPRLAGQVESLLSNANDALEDAEGLFEGASGDVRPTLLSLRQAAEALAQTLRSEQESIHRTMQNLETFTDNMSGFSETGADTLAEAVSRLNRSMSQLERSLVSLERTTTTLDEILVKVNTGDGTLGRLVNDPSLYVRMDSTVATLNALVDEIRRDPERYLRHMALVDLF